MAILTKIPRTNLMRWFVDLTGEKANVKNPLTKPKQDMYLPLARAYRPPVNGQHTRYFLDDEEEMFVITLEEAHNAAFPYDTDALIFLADEVGKKAYKVCTCTYPLPLDLTLIIAYSSCLSLPHPG